MSDYPYIKPSFNSTQAVMLDVLIALFPVLLAGCLAYGWIIPLQIAIAVGTAAVTEFIFAFLLLKRKNTLSDGSAIITALLLISTLSPLTPWYIVSFGAFSAILFGKIVWGGLGKNRFNPALVGREFSSVFFATTMSSPALWQSQELLQLQWHNLFPQLASSYAGNYLSDLIYRPTGAMGEYSVLAILIGGLYLILKNRISWHIPFSLLSTFTFLLWLDSSTALQYSIAGILLGTIFMATDMPTSPITASGKLFYGIMTAVCIYILIRGGVRFEYMSYAILLMNGFSDTISRTFTTRPWGEQMDTETRAESVLILTLKILSIIAALLTFHRYGLDNYVIYLYIIYIIFKFNFSFSKTVKKYV
jgi:electron transport complex protein RnfD